MKMTFTCVACGKRLETEVVVLNGEISVVRPATEDPDTRSIHNLNLSVRAYNAVLTAKIETVDELASWTSTELLLLKNFGKVSLREVERELLAQFGLLLRNRRRNINGEATGDAAREGL